MEHVRKVLLVEDNPGDARLVTELISDIGRDIELDIAETLTSAIESLVGTHYDTVLLDLGLPESTGLDTYQRLRDAAPDVATIILTGNTDPRLALHVVRAGAQDFLLKGRVDAELLDRAMTYAASRQQAELELRRQTESLAEAQAVAHLGSWRMNIETGDIACSEETARILGLPPSPVGHTLREAAVSMAHPDDRERVRAAWSAVAAGDTEPMEYRITRDDGEVRWVYWRARLERDEHGNPVGAVGILQDVTERLEAQASILRGEEFNRALIEGLRQHALLLLTDEGLLNGWNVGAERLFELREEETTGLRIADLAVEHAGVTALEDAILEAVRLGRSSTACLLRRGPDQEFWGDVSMSRVERAESGRGIAVIVHDATESKLAADRDAVRAAVGTALADTDSLESAWQGVLRDICFGLGWEIGEAWELDERDEDLHFTSIWAADHGLVHTLETYDSQYRFQSSEAGPFAAMRARSPLISRELTSVAHGARLFELRQLGVEKITIVPVVDGQRNHAVMLFYSSRPAIDEASTLPLLEDIGVQIAQFATRERLKQQIAAAGLFDSLTGLPSSTLFTERLAQALSRRPLRADPSALVVLAEVDQFDSVSDNYGRPIAERVVFSVAERIRSSFGEGDTVASFSGGVLAILVNDVRAGAQESEVLDRMSTTLIAPIELDGATVHATVSTGSTLGGPSDTAEETIRRALIALHRARALGRGARVLFDQGMLDSAERALGTEEELRRAIDHGEFEVFYQPVIRISSRQIVGAEALIRWHHPTRGLVMPDQFIPEAEETGLIGAIGEFVLKTACEECARWQPMGDTPMGVSVNLSPSQFTAEDLAQAVLSALHAGRLSPSLLTVEITESVLMSDASNALHVLERLREVGVGVSMDDFGTGYSSLNYLKRLPIDTLKIDRSFVSGIPDDMNDVAIVAAVLSMAQALGLTVVAEGVEHDEQLQLLGAHECEFAQGYLFSKAVPAAEFLRMLQEWEYVPGAGPG